MTPAFYRQRCFSVSETADIAELTEDTLRTWLARNTSEFCGDKRGHRLWFSAHDAYFFTLLRDMVGFGVSVKIAMYNAARLADDGEAGGPLIDEVLVIRRDGDTTRFRLMSRHEMAEVEQASLFIPLRQSWQRVIERAAVHFTSEAA